MDVPLFSQRKVTALYAFGLSNLLFFQEKKTTFLLKQLGCSIISHCKNFQVYITMLPAQHTKQFLTDLCKISHEISKYFFVLQLLLFHTLSPFLFFPHASLPSYSLFTKKLFIHSPGFELAPSEWICSTRTAQVLDQTY